jgi:hypothetical protein
MNQIQEKLNILDSNLQILLEEIKLNQVELIQRLVDRAK